MEVEKQTLVVVSKIKALAKKAGFNTSAEVIDPLSSHLEKLVAKAIESAKADGRKTIMARDLAGLDT